LAIQNAKFPHNTTHASYTQLEFNKMIGDAELCGDQKVRNLVTDMLEEVKAGWAPDAVDTIGKKFFR